MDYGALKTTLTVVFFVVFLAIVLRLYFSKSRRYSEAARLPLEDDHGRN